MDKTAFELFDQEWKTVLVAIWQFERSLLRICEIREEYDSWLKLEDDEKEEKSASKCVETSIEKTAMHNGNSTKTSFGVESYNIV